MSLTIDDMDDYLLETLREADLERFAQLLAEKLQVTKLEHFSHVKDSDLSSIGLSQPAIKRLKVHIKEKKSALKRQQSKTHTFSKLKSGKLSPNNLSSARAKSTGDAPSFNEESSNVTCLISKDDIKLLEKLGEGSFGIVKRGSWKRSNGKKMDVAVKLIRNLPGTSSSTSGNDISEDSLLEINAMHALRHPNLIRLYGLVLSAPIMMVTELCEGGALLDRLRSTNLPVLLIDQLIDYGLQIAKGMAYLESKFFIHRDLAARNVLLSENELVVKIGDFGLMRALPNREEHYVMSEQKKVPFAWCPPESLKFRQFSCASDVWAFGVTLWEMFSYGEEPWCGLNGAEILQKVAAGGRLPEPSACPTAVFQLLCQCWALDAAQRPTFAALKELLHETTLIVGKSKEAQTGEGLLELDSGDRIIVIDGNADNYYWFGQNVRTHKLGKFARKNIILEESTIMRWRRRGGGAHDLAEDDEMMTSTMSSATAERKGSSVFFELGGNGLTTKEISRPIRGSFVHTGHGDARGGESWGHADKIDKIFLNNPLWIPPSTKKTTDQDRQRKAASISCARDAADDQRASLVFNDELVAEASSNHRETLSEDERKSKGRMTDDSSNGANVPRRNDSYHLANNESSRRTTIGANSSTSESRYISSNSTTSGGESSSFGSSSGFAPEFDNGEGAGGPGGVTTVQDPGPPARPYYCLPPTAEESVVPSVVGVGAPVTRLVIGPSRPPPTLEVIPSTPVVVENEQQQQQRPTYDQVPGGDPFEVPVEVKTLSNRPRYSEMYSTVGNTSGAPPPSAIPPPPPVEYTRIVKKEHRAPAPDPAGLQFASAYPTSVVEVKPVVDQQQGRSMSTSAIPPPSGPLKGALPPLPGVGSRPTAVARPFVHQQPEIGGVSTVGIGGTSGFTYGGMGSSANFIGGATNRGGLTTNYAGGAANFGHGHSNIGLGSATIANGVPNIGAGARNSITGMPNYSSGSSNFTVGTSNIAVGPTSSLGPTASTPAFAGLHQHQPPTNLVDELTRRLQTNSFNHSTTNGLSFSNGFDQSQFALPSPSGFTWTGATISTSSRTQSVPDVSHAGSRSMPSTSRAPADTHQILDLFDPLSTSSSSTTTSGGFSTGNSGVAIKNVSSTTGGSIGGAPPKLDDLIRQVRAGAPFAAVDRCTLVLRRCRLNVQTAIHELKTEKLVDMGLADRERCVRALETSEWDVNAAAEKLLGKSKIRQEERRNRIKMDIDSILDERTDPQDLRQFETIYNEERSIGEPSKKATFEYAFCLVRGNKEQSRLGVQLLEDLLHREDADDAMRDYLYYISVGYVKLAKYDTALKHVEALLRVEPTNNQALNLRDGIKKKMKKDAAVGAAVLGGAAAVGGALLVGAIAAAAAMSRK